MAFDESLLILSDVHLGNDLNDITPDAARRSARVDDDLAKLLDHYRRARPSGRRWRLVIAGDFIDFIGMALLPRGRELDTEPSEEEMEHGLGNASDHAREKLRAVAARHRAVFDALAAFVGDGHALTIVHGNHDVEFHWDAVKQEFRAMLARTALRARDESDADFVDAFASRIEFAPWFWWADGVAYVEHGHQYDALCATDHVMAPLSPLDPRRIARTFSDVLLRFVVRPTRGVPEYGHDRLGLLDYVMLGVRLGAGGLVRLAARFASAVLELFRMHRAHGSDAAGTLRQEHEKRMAALAQATRVGIDKLRALAALQVPPVTRSIRAILASVLLDRLAVALLAAVAVAVIALAGAGQRWSLPAMAGVALAWLAAQRKLTKMRQGFFGEKLDNDATLVDRAGRLTKLFPAAFVVMGHTHTPAMVSVADGAATYVNVGAWHEPEAEATDGAAYRAPRTHLVIHPASEQGRPVAELLAWGTDGPTRFVYGR